MKSALWKAGSITLAVVLFSVAVTWLIGALKHDAPGPVALSLSTFLPIVTAFPSLIFIFRQHDRLKDTHAQLQRAHRELQTRARMDSMTGLLNREALFDAMKAARARIETGAFLIVDADHFKTINDTYGHAVGDRALKLIAFALQNVTRAGDLVGRIGGEEFCIFLPGGSGETGMRVAQRIRAEVENTPFYASEYQTHRLTVSIGVATAPKSETSSHVMSRADRCLYIAKQRGRNCVVFEEEGASVVPISSGINTGREALRG